MQAEGAVQAASGAVFSFLLSGAYVVGENLNRWPWCSGGCCWSEDEVLRAPRQLPGDWSQGKFSDQCTLKPPGAEPLISTSNPNCVVCMCCSVLAFLTTRELTGKAIGMLTAVWAWISCRDVDF